MPETPIFNPGRFTQESKEAWNRAARNYDEKIARRFFERFALAMADWARLKPGENILDVACGSGIVSFAAAQQIGSSGSILGIDLSNEMIQLAQERAKGMNVQQISFKEMNAESLPLPPNSFDAALCQLGLMLFAEPKKALLEIKKVLKPQGRLLVSVQGTPDKMIFTSIVQKTMVKHAPWLKIPGAPTLYAFGPAGVLTNAFSEAGFANVEEKRLEGIFEFDSFEEYWTTLIAGAGKTKGMLESLPKDTQVVVEKDVRTLAATYQKNGRLALPYELVMAKGLKPA
ncbi:MAG: methyltransferase domain-containing protein [Elusimicrobia bacterium]|nr:methyltransferase domain-containing protein [Elusimicrobiota bacterium]